MSDDRSSLTKIVSGAAIGLFAGLAASFVMDRFQALSQPKSNSEPATQRAADKLAIATTGMPLADDKATGGQAVHYGLGMALGIGYGIAAEFAPGVTAGFGTAFGTGIWTVLDEAAVPATGLGDPPWKSPPTTQGYALISHIIFGITAELSRRLGRRALASVVAAPPRPRGDDGYFAAMPAAASSRSA